MSKEIKTQEFSDTRESNNKIYVAIIAIVAILGLFTIFKSHNDKNITASKEVVGAQTVATEEATIARIYVSTKLVDADVPQFEVYVDDSETSEKQEKWLTNFGIQGYAITGDKGRIDLTINVLNDAKLSIALKGIYQLDENKKIIEKWVKYTSFTINGVSILDEPTEAWHNKPFNYTIDTNAGEVYKIHIEWTKADR